MITALDHFTVLCRDLDRSVTFYAAAFGLAAGPRPDLGFAGAWLYAGGQAVLHLVAGRQVPGAGVIDHVALRAAGLPVMKARLEALEIAYRLARQAGSGTWQLFCHDPDGARIELTFDAAETE
jgi:catechol 2,3-dioxygenase-like lactoylglutathione lyase family enzyme